jgi:copper(I)-binding protein
MILLTFACAALLAGASSGKVVTVADAWVRTPNPAVSITAGFMTIENPTARPVALTGASTSAAAVVEMHEMRMVDGQMSMRKVEKIEIPAGGRVRLEPGGLHLMLFELKEKIVDGTRVEFVLKFDDGTEAKVGATARSPEGMH